MAVDEKDLVAVDEKDLVAVGEKDLVAIDENSFVTGVLSEFTKDDKYINNKSVVKFFLAIADIILMMSGPF